MKSLIEISAPFAVVLIVLTVSIANSATITAVSDGTWTTNAVWSCNCQPNNADNITIPTGITITATSSPLLILGPVITINIGGTLILKNATLTVDGNDVVTIQSGGKISGSGLLGGNVLSGLTTIPVASGSSVNGPSSITGGILPIKLASFSGAANHDSIILDWTSASEENFDHYNVLRSENGINFHSIGSAPGNANSTIKRNYSFEDKSPLDGKLYYRLEAVDRDGSSEYFNIIMVEFIPAHEDDISIYPNPVSDLMLNVKFNSAPNHSHELFLYDSKGFLVMRKPLQKEDVLSSHTLPSNLERGIYFVVIKSTETNFRSAVYLD